MVARLSAPKWTYWHREHGLQTSRLLFMSFKWTMAGPKRDYATKHVILHGVRGPSYWRPRIGAALGWGCRGPSLPSLLD